MFSEGRLEAYLCLLGSAEVVLDNADNILLNLVVVLKNKGALLSLGALLPQ